MTRNKWHAFDVDPGICFKAFVALGAFSVTSSSIWTLNLSCVPHDSVLVFVFDADSDSDKHNVLLINVQDCGRGFVFCERFLVTPCEGLFVGWLALRRGTWLSYNPVHFGFILDPGVDPVIFFNLNIWRFCAFFKIWVHFFKANTPIAYLFHDGHF